MSAVVIWRPEPLTARLIAAARPAAAEVTGLARAKAATASKRVSASIFMKATSPTDFQVGAASELGILFEEGVRPHEIKPRRNALQMADGSWVSGPVQHPGMRAQPFLHPVLPSWAPLYRRAALGAFRGF